MNYIQFLDAHIHTLQEQQQMYAAACRKDDGDLTKIQINIFGVCKTIYETYRNIGKTDTDYLRKLDELAQSWRTAMDEASGHGDTARAAIEEIKLDTLRIARTRFLAQKEETK